MPFLYLTFDLCLLLKSTFSWTAKVLQTDMHSVKVHAGEEVPCINNNLFILKVPIYIFYVHYSKLEADKYKHTFEIACSFIINKFSATDLSISPDEYCRPYLGNLLFLGSDSLAWILPSDYFSTDSKQYLSSLQECQFFSFI